ncbi:NAD(P)/FAD-dependent oxidoreductase [Actinoplanes sp. TFC3]|uniref:NAD(P)/FAD-dependent oxidoreductase n=1 Tax=Actinoplanes sp. TFC3 TaxID=1710355 RepID=UPI000830E3D2|nr:NAD(P)/FAD-dependent oxidoreductase [Actinoplanes sp. TFC3]
MYDVAVVGGSVAGLQSALTLGRARRRVLLADDGNPRNAAASHLHNFLGQPDTSPAALLDTGRAMLAEYDVTVVRRRVPDIQTTGGSLTVGEHGSARAVVLATGLIDELPDVPGIAALWGDRVVACPHCHGWEVRDQPLVQLGWRGRPDHGVQRALLLRGWSSDVTLLTDGDELSTAARKRLDAAGVTIRCEAVEQVSEGVDIRLAGGTTLHPRKVFTVVRQRQQSDLAARLGCRLDPDTGAVLTDDVGRTSVPSVWAAGTTAFPALLAIGAAGHASSVATALHAELAGL